MGFTTGDAELTIAALAASAEVPRSTAFRILATLEEGDFFGEAALLSGEPRNASVFALEDVELYVLGKADFQAVIEASASFKLLKKSCNDCHAAYRD